MADDARIDNHRGYSFKLPLNCIVSLLPFSHKSVTASAHYPHIPFVPDPLYLPPVTSQASRPPLLSPTRTSPNPLYYDSIALSPLLHLFTTPGPLLFPSPSDRIVPFFSSGNIHVDIFAKEGEKIAVLRRVDIDKPSVRVIERYLETCSN